MTTLQEKIDVMQAAADGQTIQVKGKRPNAMWEDTYSPEWNWYNGDYRIKPEGSEVEMGLFKRTGISSNISRVWAPYNKGDDKLASFIRKAKFREVV